MWVSPILSILMLGDEYFFGLLDRSGNDNKFIIKNEEREKTLEKWSKSFNHKCYEFIKRINKKDWNCFVL